ncbi:unnamed protein product [Rhizophagus irregularis]|nr:unnamed protein product [Rhizophagus irregularis]CAB5360425.1 unnamed protein product [Rhizophagus irregularis]
MNRAFKLNKECQLFEFGRTGLSNAGFLVLDETAFQRTRLFGFGRIRLFVVECRILGFGRNGFEKSKITYPFATETLTKFREDSALVNGTRLENKVPVSIPKLLVQDQDLYKTLTCLDRYHNGDSKNAGFLGLNEIDFQNRNAGFRNWTNQTFVEGTLTPWILAKMTLYHTLFPGLVHENLA